MTGLHPTNVGIVTVALFLAGVAGPAIDRQPAAAERPPDAFSWHAPDRASKVAALVPGRGLRMPSPEEFLADWTRRQAEKWDGAHRPAAPEEAYAEHAAAAPNDEELLAQMPDHISPVAIVLRGKPSRDDAKFAMVAYCPLCGSRWSGHLQLDPKNPYHGWTPCCLQHFYERPQDYPADYKYRPNGAASFQHLDDTVKEVPGYTFTGTDGVTWQIFPGTLVALYRYRDIISNLPVEWAQRFTETGDPRYVHKIAVFMDRMADIYYGLPLSDCNELARRKDGRQITRADWESLPRPVPEGDVFGHHYQRGRLFYWAKRMPLHAGWFFHAGRELMWVEPFARVRHHPVFKYYSQRKYGDPEALDRKVRNKMLGEMALLMRSFQISFSYQDGSAVELAMLGLLTGNRELFEFAAALHECVLYNHHFQDGMNGEGAPNYQWLCGQYYYPAIVDPNGWLQIAPNFLKEHPFFQVAWDLFTSPVRSCNCLYTARGLPIEQGDQHVRTYDTRFLTDPEKVAAHEKRPSQNWPGYGVGILRVGGPGHRQEVFVNYQRGTGHSHTHSIGLECWVDGVPVMRQGNYADYHAPANLDRQRPEIQAFLAMPYARQAFEVVLRGQADFNSRDWAMQHWAHNTVSVDEASADVGAQEHGRGFGDLVTYKGGETPGQLGAHFQVLDCEQLHAFEGLPGGKVHEFRRTLVGVEGPDGRPYVLDVLRLRGGRRHALYNSAWAATAEEHLPAATAREPDFAAYLDTLRRQPAESLPWRMCYQQIKPATVHAAGAEPFDVTWKTDVTAYMPCDKEGKPRPRPIPDDVGRVRLRLIGMPDAGKTDLVRARGPWIAITDQPLPNGAALAGYVGYRDALDYLIESRAQEGDGLQSCFTHLLEGYREGEPSSIAKVERLAAAGGPLPEGVVALKISLTSGPTDLLVFQPQRSGKMPLLQFAGGLATDACYALVRLNDDGQAVEAHAVRGTRLTCGQLSLQGQGDCRGTLVDLVGDLTGTHQQSALIVRPDTPWPAGNQLAGRPISIGTMNGHREAYTVEKVAPQAGGLVRVELANHAPFAVGWHQVSRLDPARPNLIETPHHFEAGGDTWRYRGCKIWFPQRDRAFTIERVTRYDAPLELAEGENPAAQGIKVGDWFAIYEFSPGASVEIPSVMSSAGCGRAATNSR